MSDPFGEVREDDPLLAEDLRVEAIELRHTAGDEIWRVTGDIVKAQKLLRYESVATTETYLHPNQDGLAEAMRAVDHPWAAEEKK